MSVRKGVEMAEKLLKRSGKRKVAAEFVGIQGTAGFASVCDFEKGRGLHVP